MNDNSKMFTHTKTFTHTVPHFSINYLLVYKIALLWFLEVNLHK